MGQCNFTILYSFSQNFSSKSCRSTLVLIEWPARSIDLSLLEFNLKYIKTEVTNRKRLKTITLDVFQNLNDGFNLIFF